MPEGADIDEAQPDSTEVLIHTGKVAVLAKFSREQYSTAQRPRCCPTPSAVR